MSDAELDNNESSRGLEGIEFVQYRDESMIPDIQRLVAADLSEPYSIFTYRYFLHNWPDHCICGYVTETDSDGQSRRKMIATIVSKSGPPEGSYDENKLQGYIAMLAVDKNYRKRGIGSYLVHRGIEAMFAAGCREIMLETEVVHYRCAHLVFSSN